MPLPSLQTRLHRAAQTAGSPLQVIEKDYALSYILAGIASHDLLAHALIFKGGTALKKLYFGHYRFSEDLDFSTIDG
ncbi:MAG: nucleotidyl transferase AbiEii/AbiGii toxin family protein [bacterium]